jgi:hypothetical protein
VRWLYCRLKEMVKKVWRVGRYGRIPRRTKTRFSHRIERGYDPAVSLADPGKQGAEERCTMADVGMAEKVDWTLMGQAFLAEVRS